MNVTHSRTRMLVVLLSVLAMLGASAHGRGQAALLMEEPYGFFGALNPTGHTAIYFSRICADSPVKLRRCEPDETGSVIARYQGIAGNDWVAMPLIPYLYSVENVSEVPSRVNRETVLRLRKHYHEQHLGTLGANVFEGNIVHGGWTQLVGVAYERRIVAFRFATTEEQDDTLIAEMNDSRNHTSFNLLYENCADFARRIMNEYFPQTFKRTIFPDAGITTPRQIASKLVKYASKHPDTELAVFEISQVPGYRRHSRSNKSVSASLITRGYALPLAMVNPYLAGGIFVDYLLRGRFSRIPDHPPVLQPDQLSELGASPQPLRHPAGAPVQSSTVSTALEQSPASPVRPAAARSIVSTHE